MVKVTQPACGLPGLSPGNLIPEAQLIPRSCTVAQFSLLCLFLHIVSYDAKNCSCQNLGAVISPMIPMNVLQLAPKPRPYSPSHPPPHRGLSLPYSLCPAHRVSPDNFGFLPSTPALLSYNLVLMLTHPALPISVVGLLPYLSIPLQGQGRCDRFLTTSNHLVQKPANRGQPKGPSDLF